MRPRGMSWVAPCLLGVALLFGGPAWAKADVIFSNLGPGDSWDHNNGRTIAGPNGVGATFAQGFAFTPASTTNFGTLELPLGYFSGTNDFKVQLRSDSSGLPGATLEAFDFPNLPTGPFDAKEPLSVAQSVLHPQLVGGTPYWVVVLPGAADTSGAWNDNSINQTGNVAISHDGGTTWKLNEFGQAGTAAFRVSSQVEAVPEPASLALLGVGLAGLAGYGLRRRRRAG